MSETTRAPMRRVGVLYQDRPDGASALAQTIAQRLQATGRSVWTAALHKGEEHLGNQLREVEVALVLGGDGSILSVARLCAPLAVPILGINFGRVGFLTELEPAEVEEKLPLYLDGHCWVDERAMLQAEITQDGTRHTFLALNDIVLVRGAEPRVIRIQIWLDGHFYNTTVADGIIVSTATGSTAYNLAAGGPILYPQVRSNVLTPIAPHLVADRSLILEPDAVVTLQLDAVEGAVLSADGQLNLPVHSGTRVGIARAASSTHFLRRRPPTHFYRILSAKLRDNL